MRHKISLQACVLAACVSLTASATQAARPEVSSAAQPFGANFSAASLAQDKNKTAGQTASAPNISEGERKAIDKINKAKDTPAKIAAASEFIKKYPQSTVRAKVAEYVAGQVSTATDPAQKISLAESYMGVFTEPSETAYVQGMLLDAYIKTKRLDDAFRVAGTVLARDPNDVGSLTSLAYAGTGEVINNNDKYQQQSEQYGLKAIELLEGDKKPASFTDAQWQEYKTSWLPRLYDAMTVLAVKSGNSAQARARAEKAVALKTTNPNVYVVLANLANEDYQRLAVEYQTMSAGAAKDAKLKEAQAQLDKVIEQYAQAVAITEADARLKPLHDQLMGDLESYYKYRHNNSTDGLQQIIAKYRTTATK